MRGLLGELVRMRRLCPHQPQMPAVPSSQGAFSFPPPHLTQLFIDLGRSSGTALILNAILCNSSGSGCNLATTTERPVRILFLLRKISPSSTNMAYRRSTRIIAAVPVEYPAVYSFYARRFTRRLLAIRRLVSPCAHWRRTKNLRLRASAQSTSTTTR